MIGRRVKRIIMKQLEALGRGVADKVVDVSMAGVKEMRLGEAGVEVMIEGEPEPRIIPFGNLAVIIPEKESAEETAAKLEAERTPTEPDYRRPRK